jgi:hypothetical protein
VTTASSPGAALGRRRFLYLLGGGAAAAAVSYPLLQRDRPAYPAPVPLGVGAGLAGVDPVAALAAQGESALVTSWFRLSLDLVQSVPGFTPPVAARLLGYAGVALHEALAGAGGQRPSLAGRLNGLSAVPRPGGAGGDVAAPLAANAALAEVLRGLTWDPAAPTAGFPPAAQIAALERDLGRALQPAGESPAARRSQRYGQDVGKAILAWAAQDGADGAHLRRPGASGWQPPQQPGAWQPTPPAYAPALQPGWGRNRPLLLPATDAFDPGPPPAYSTDPQSDFFAEALEVYTTVERLTGEQLATARYWADDVGPTPTPPGHWVSIANQLTEQRTLSLDAAAEGYTRMGIALADSFVCCWGTKFRYALLRPVTYIRDVIDPHWGDDLPLTTPAFPEYTSGHSSQSAAAAAVLAQTFGDGPFTDRTYTDRGRPPRTYDSFAAAAQEAAISRLYGGIHFRSAIERGLEQGERIGAEVTALRLA